MQKGRGWSIRSSAAPKFTPSALVGRNEDFGRLPFRALLEPVTKRSVSQRCSGDGPNVHQSQAPAARNVTGPLMSRMSFVAATFVVMDGARDGTTRALELVFIGDDGVSPGFQKSAPVRSRKIGRCATGSKSIRAARNNRNSSAWALACRWANATRFRSSPVLTSTTSARFRVFEHKAAKRRQFQFVTVGDLDGDDVMLAVGLAAAP